MWEVARVIESPKEFVTQKFNEYYRKNRDKLPLPTSLEKREFGFILFNEKTMIRHKAFEKPRFFRDFINSVTPSDVYYSSAYYEEPSKEMDKKGWLGADLIFDIDADHIPTTCKVEHEYWMCEGCDNAGMGKHPSICSECGSIKFKKGAWLCEMCLETAKAEALKLIDFLIDDFGFPPDDIEVFFSGHRGYHIHVKRDEIRSLNSDARKEIVDYILGTGLKVDLHGLRELGGRARKEVVGPDLKDPGWWGKIARGVYDLLVSYSLQQLQDIKGINRSAASVIYAHRDEILQSWDTRPPWGLVKGVGIKTWEKLAEIGVKKQAVAIDTVVTTDIRRLIRMPFTLHGKTGLKVISVSSTSLESLDPLRDAIAFDEGSLKVYVKETHHFRVGEETYGPYRREIVELPTAAAVYLFCKRVAHLTDSRSPL